MTCRLEATVDRLHRAGVVHGALRPEHVALDADGRPVLVGFGAARHSTDTSGGRVCPRRAAQILPFWRLIPVP